MWPGSEEAGKAGNKKADLRPGNSKSLLCCVNCIKRKRALPISGLRGRASIPISRRVEFVWLTCYAHYHPHAHASPPSPPSPNVEEGRRQDPSLQPGMVHCVSSARLESWKLSRPRSMFPYDLTDRATRHCKVTMEKLKPYFISRSEKNNAKIKRNFLVTPLVFFSFF